MSSKALIIPAAGVGKRMQREKAKPFIKLSGKTILAHTVGQFLELDGLIQIVVATSAEYIGEAESILLDIVPDKITWQCVEGGTERQHSIYNALEVVEDVELVMVHDAVRPFVTPAHIKQCCREAEKCGAAVLGIPSKDTIKRVNDELLVEETPQRKYMWQVQTPQVFKVELLKHAYSKALEDGFLGTDDASLVEWLGKPVRMVEGSVKNIKLTYPRDLTLAKVITEQEE